MPSIEDAEDVASEAMLRCATFEQLDEARLGQFLTAITLRLCADFYRDADRGTRLVRRLDIGEEPSPEDLACAAADAGMLNDLLRRLPDSQRAVLVDRAQGLSVTQISHRHSLTYKAVESALARARSTMRTALASAMAVAFGMAEALRRRAIPEMAVPAASVAFVAAVVAPFLPHAGGGRDGVALPAARPPALVLSQTASAPRPAVPAVRPEPRPAPAGVAVPKATDAKPKPKPTGTPYELAVGEGDGKVSVARDGDGRLFTEDDVRECVRNGPQLHPNVDWNGPYGYPQARPEVDCTP